MNVKFVVLLAFMLLPLVSSWGQDNVIDEVVWVVGDEAISQQTKIIRQKYLNRNHLSAKTTILPPIAIKYIT